MSIPDAGHIGWGRIFTGQLFFLTGPSREDGAFEMQFGVRVSVSATFGQAKWGGKIDEAIGKNKGRLLHLLWMFLLGEREREVHRFSSRQSIWPSASKVSMCLWATSIINMDAWTAQFGSIYTKESLCLSGWKFRSPVSYLHPVMLPMEEVKKFQLLFSPLCPFSQNINHSNTRVQLFIFSRQSNYTSERLKGVLTNCLCQFISLNKQTVELSCDGAVLRVNFWRLEVCDGQGAI